MRLLFIVPRNKPAEHPIIDELTMKMTGALRKGAKPELLVMGAVVCVCGAAGGLSDVILPNGWVTSTLSVHFLAYHRDEVPAPSLKLYRRSPLVPRYPVEMRSGIPSSVRFANISWSIASMISARSWVRT
jgi:hypothetical protein